MFEKNKVSKSMIDAVNMVLEDKKRMITDAEVDETGFHKAAHAAKRANQSHFEFQGKKYPVTAKSHKEAIEMEEGWDDMMKAVKDKAGPQPSGGSGVKQGHRYGGSKQKDKPEHDEPKDKMKKEEVSFKERLLESMKQLQEKEMSDKQMKKREDIVMSMKDKTSYFKKKYGKDWKSVMYATATKQAMKEELDELEEKIDPAKKTVDMLRGRVAMPKGFDDGNEHKSTKVKLSAEEADCVTPSQAKKIADKEAKKEVSHHNTSMHKGQKNTVKMESVDDLDEGMMDTMKKVGSKVLSKLGHGDDEAMRKNLQKKMGMPQTGKKPTKEEVELTEGHHMHTHTVHFSCPMTGEWKGKMIYNADHDKEAIEMAKDMAKKQDLKVMKVSKNNVIMSDKTMGEETIFEAFKGPESGSGTGDNPFVTNESKPLVNAKAIAHKALQRVKNEMMGKAPGNN